MNAVSVVITCYNYGKYIARCVESVLGQTFQDFEIIIVDDGSTDNTGEIIAPYLTDSRIHYIKQENAGQAVAKNAGIINSKSEFIAFLDADDLWDHTKLEKQIPLFSDPYVGVVYSSSRYIDGDGKDFIFRIESDYMMPKSGYVSKHLLFDNFVPFSSSVVRRECFERVGLFNESLSMGIDWDLWLRISVYYQFQYVDEPLLLYRIGHSGQMSRNLEKRIRCADSIFQAFLEANPDIVSPYLRRRILHYSCVSRGKYLRNTNLKMSNHYLLKAFITWPFSLEPLKELIKTYLLRIIGK